MFAEKFLLLEVLVVVLGIVDAADGYSVVDALFIDTGSEGVLRHLQANSKDHGFGSFIVLVASVP